LTVKLVIVVPEESPIVKVDGLLEAPVAVTVADSISCEPELCTVTVPATPARVSDAASADPVSAVSRIWKFTVLFRGTFVALSATDGPAIDVKLEITAAVVLEIARLFTPVTLESVMATSPVTSIFSTLVQRTGVIAVAVPGVPLTSDTVSVPAPPSSASPVVKVVAVPLLNKPKNVSGPLPPANESVLAVSGLISQIL